MKIAKITPSFKTLFQSNTVFQKGVKSNKERPFVRSIQWALTCLLMVWINKGQAQSDIVAPIDFNIERDKPLRNSNGLTVSMKLASWNEHKTKLAILDGASERELIKGVFELFITVQNDGPNDIAIYDWSFSVICPKNVHGQEWQANSQAPQLMTAIIPSGIFIVLKPGEKKRLLSAPSDFYWCLSPDPSTLLVEPRFLTARIVCGVINPTKNLVNFKPDMQQLIQDYWRLVSTGKTDEATAKRQEILNLGDREYPTKKQELIALLDKTATGGNTKRTLGAIPDGVLDKNNKVINPPGTREVTNGSQENNSVYSDWGTIKNPDYSMQVRYKLEKQQGDIGYFRAQLRINFEDPSICNVCIGYHVCIGYPTLDGLANNYVHCKLYYSYKEIYTVPDLLPMKISFADGSKRILKNDGFYSTKEGSDKEEYISYLFENYVGWIKEGKPSYCNHKVESEQAVNLK